METWSCQVSHLGRESWDQGQIGGWASPSVAFVSHVRHTLLLSWHLHLTRDPQRPMRHSPHLERPGPYLENGQLKLNVAPPVFLISIALLLRTPDTRTLNWGITQMKSGERNRAEQSGVSHKSQKREKRLLLLRLVMVGSRLYRSL